ncbi:hypothetical protein [Variovorax guangxiensis]|uniref:hypothetical protein n=1 Tax=Variovorax guangxiensis TaxID=1775474 RepID=UPI00285FEBAC|nr:hypothetical protein [Variovorax guangxiensis]MDR6861417.1 hypothetical protein [Variovorax guangxiensis]
MQKFVFQKNGETVSQDTIRRMEVRRARHMMSLLMDKLGAEGMAKLFAKELEESDAKKEAWAAASKGEWVESRATALVSEGNSAEFLNWVRTGYSGANGMAMQRAHPEHLGKLALEGGVIGILEIAGHTAMPSLLRLEVLPDDAELPVPMDPAFPHRWLGRGVCRNGQTFAYMAHQLRDTPSGFEARFIVWWGAAAPQDLVSGHVDHLMVEWANWLQMYLETRKQPADLMPIALTVNT